MRKELRDRKSWLSFAVFNLLNVLTVRFRFDRIKFIGSENIPKNRPFLLVSNHISRWDGLVLHKLIERPSNWMVSPNELKGLQGLILRSMGAFPADSGFRLVEFVRSQAARGEGIVIFPEGNVFYDGTTHPFKNGASRLALSCASAGIPLSVVPAAVHYGTDKRTATVSVGEPVDLSKYVEEYREQSNMGIRSLTVRLNREVCHLRHSLGVQADNLVLFTGPKPKRWAPRLFGEEVREERATSGEKRREAVGCAEAVGAGAYSVG